MDQSLNIRTRFTAIGAALVAVILVCGGNNAFAQRNATATANVSAKIVSGISLEKTRDLNFGPVVRTSAGGTATINATTGAMSYSGVSQGQNGGQQTASFTVTGEPSYLYTISLPHSATLSEQNGNGHGQANGHAQMTVTDFTYSDGAGTLNESGTQSFTVGGTLQVGPNQDTGNYTGSFDVTVEYQ